MSKRIRQENCKFFKNFEKNGLSLKFSC